MWWVGSWTHEPAPALYIYIYSRPWAHISRGWGTYILSLLFYTVNVYCENTSIYEYIYIYTFNNFHSSCQFIGDVLCTSDAFHIRIRNDCSEQVCVSFNRFFQSRFEIRTPIASLSGKKHVKAYVVGAMFAFVAIAVRWSPSVLSCPVHLQGSKKHGLQSRSQL